MFGKVFLLLEQQKKALKCYWNYQNITEVQEAWRSTYGRMPSTCNLERKNIEPDCPVKYMRKQHSRRPHAVTSEKNWYMLCINAPKGKSTLHAYKIEMSRTSVQCIMKAAKGKSASALTG